MATANGCIDPETGQPFRIGGCLLSGRPSGFPKFEASQRLSREPLPSSVDLRIFMTQIENQKGSQSCVANALVGALEFLIKKRYNQPIDISRLFIYYNSRLRHELSEFNIRDNGTYIWTAVAALQEFGSCKEDLYPFDLRRINDKPPKSCYEEAKQHRVTETMRLEVDLNEMKTCLAEGYPFVFGLYVYGTFMDVGKDGLVPMPPLPSSYEAKSPRQGWHAMLAVGYSDKLQCFFVRNSFSEGWGDMGYCYIPYDYMHNRQLCNDLHVIKLLAGISRPRDEEIPRNQENSWQIRNTNNNTVAPDPKDILDDEFSFKYFWNFDDTLEYLNRRWRDRWARYNVRDTSQPHQVRSYHSKMISQNNAYPMRYILWIENHHEINNVVTQITRNQSVQIDFYETLSEAEKHLLNNMNQIRSLPTFQIICRGYYQCENKNPLNLLDLLNRHGLNRIPVLVFTLDKSGVQHHLQRQASSIGINDWQQRLIIIDNAEELVRKCKENMNK